MTLQEQLCEKMRVEQSAYCLWLTAQPPEEILHPAYEYSVREDIMRLDKFLKVSRLIKRRTVANEACEAGRVLVNDKPAKASVKVKPGDIIEIQFGTRTVKVEVLDIKDTTKKEEAGDLFKYL